MEEINVSLAVKLVVSVCQVVVKLLTEQGPSASVCFLPLQETYRGCSWALMAKTGTDPVRGQSAVIPHHPPISNPNDTQQFPENVGTTSSSS